MKDIIERVAPLDAESRAYIIERFKSYEIEIGHLKAQYDKLSERLPPAGKAQYSIIARAKREIRVALCRYERCSVFFNRFKGRFTVLTQDARINREQLSKNSIFVCVYSSESPTCDIEEDLYQTLIEL